MGYPYASLAQIQTAAGGAEKLLALANQAGGAVLQAGVITDGPTLAVITEMQAKADAWIDSYLRLRFATPIANPSITIAEISADEVVYRMRLAAGMVGDIYDKARRDRERQLENMRDGKQRPDEPLPAQSTAVVAAFVENDGPMSRRGLKGIL